MRRLLLGALLIIAGCGGSTTSDTGPGGAGAGGTSAMPSCTICRAAKWDCNPGTGMESVDFRIDSRSENGCSGTFLSPGGTSMGHMDVTCSPPQKCDTKGCVDATLTDTTLHYGTATCWAL